ncbi:MAG: IS4 family transposase [Flavobacteriales bacterium]|nr:IS4 family transposase [Flavobacteriales bacterium]NCQ58953.1 IS4 family transposase [Flavobacteriales bacterium]
MIKRFDSKIAEIFDKSSSLISVRWNLARKKLFFALVFSVMDIRNVQFTELALKLNHTVSPESNLRRIQLFFSRYQMNFRVIAILLMGFVEQKKFQVSIDRTNWRFGSQNINFLVLTVCFKGVGIPILFHLLDKKGNSNQGERIDLLQEFIDIFGGDRISSLVGDREFIGKKWLSWLLANNIPFSMRVPKSHTVTLRNGEVHKVEGLLATRTERFFKKVIVDGVRLNIAMKTLKDDLLIVVGTHCPKKLFKDYKRRWGIEVFFQSLKGRGFHIENTHLKDLRKLRILFAILALAFVFCLYLGLHHHQKVQGIKIKNHGYKANSFFRKGLDKWRRVCIETEESIQKFKKYSEIIHEIFFRNFNTISGT